MENGNIYIHDKNIALLNECTCFIHICAVRRFTAQIEISNQQMIFIIHMRVLWQVESIYYQTICNLSHINLNSLINKESKYV